MCLLNFKEIRVLYKQNDGAMSVELRNDDGNIL